MSRFFRAWRAVTLSGCAIAMVGVPGAAEGKVWKRIGPNGTEEFTNVAPVGRGWRLVDGAERPASAPRPAESAGTYPVMVAPRGRADAGTMWTREHTNGTVEFTNLAPVGARWKVLFRTGPGKAAATRGRSDIVPARDTSAARFSRFDAHIRDQYAFYGIPQALIRAVIKTESDFDPRVVSSAGAAGLMQLMPETARSMGVTDIWDPDGIQLQLFQIGYDGVLPKMAKKQ